MGLCEPKHINLSVNKERKTGLCITNAYRFSTTQITETTEIIIWFDSSGSMDSTLTPLQTMRDTLLKERLLPFYNDDEDLFDEKVTVQSWSDERVFDRLAVEPADVDDGVIHLLFADEAQPVYHGLSFDGTRTSEYDTDIAALRDKFNNTFPTGKYRATIFQVETDTVDQFAAFKQFLEAVENSQGNYSNEFSLADFPNRVNFIYDINPGDTAEYYMQLVEDAVFLSEQEKQQRDRYHVDLMLKKEKELGLLLQPEKKCIMVVGDYSSTPEPPPVPQNFAVELVEAEGITDAECTWDEVAVAESYNIYLSKNEEGFIKQNEDPVTELEFTIESLDDAAYEAYVVAVRSGVESEPSNTEVFTIGAGELEEGVEALEGLIVWGDANSIDEAHEVSISTIPDRKENYDATAMGTEPILLHDFVNGKKALDFRSADNMTLGTNILGSTELYSNPSSGSPYTIYTVTLLLGNGYTFTKAADGSFGRQCVMGSLSGSWITALRGTVSSHGTRTGIWTIEKLQWDGSEPTYKRNDLDPTIPTNGNQGKFNPDIIIGGRTNATGFSMNGYYAEYLVFERALTAEEDLLVREYLGTKYDIAYA